MMKMSMFKKLLLGFLASIVLLVSIVPYFSTAHAQTWYNQPFIEWNEKVFNEDNPEEIFGERYTYAQVEWIIYSLVAFLMNNLGNADLNNCLMESSDPFNPSASGNCIGELTAAIRAVIALSEPAGPEKNWLASFSNRPISTVAYFKDIAARLNLVPEAKAQGFGFAAANTVLGLWRTVRNITYFLLILVIIVMSFMIMFRVKTSPQTVITVQSALPKIIIALLLITFSYAIAGFLIDLMYVVIGLLAAFVTTSDISSTRDFGEMFGLLTTENNWFLLMTKYFLAFIISFICSLFGSCVAGGLGVLGLIALTVGAGGIFLIIILLLTLILLLILGLRILWLLIKTYVTILLLIIFGPIQILIGTLGFGGFGAWVKSLVAQLAVYPLVGFMFIISFVFLRATLPSGTIIDELFPFGVTNVFGTGTPWDPPLTVGSAANILYLGASVAVLSLIPQAANIIKGLVSGRGGAELGSAIGQAMGPLGLGFMGGEYLAGREIERRKDAFGRLARTAGPETAQSLFRELRSRLRNIK